MADASVSPEFSLGSQEGKLLKKLSGDAIHDIDKVPGELRSENSYPGEAGRVLDMRALNEHQDRDEMSLGNESRSVGSDVFANSEKPQEGTQRHQNESYTSTGKSQGSTRDDVRVEESLRVSEAEEGAEPQLHSTSVDGAEPSPLLLPLSSGPNTTDGDIFLYSDVPIFVPSQVERGRASSERNSTSNENRDISPRPLPLSMGPDGDVSPPSLQFGAGRV